MKVKRPARVEVTPGEFMDVMVEVEVRDVDLDESKSVTTVLDEVDAALAACHPGRTDVAELRDACARLAKLVRRGFGIGTSPSGT